MKKATLLVLLLCATSVFATPPALTTVTATLTDSSTQVWANATWTTTFIPPFGNPGVPNNNGNPVSNSQSGVADGSGVFTVILDDNNVVAPAGSKWKFSICPNASVTSCNDIQIVITGATMDVSTQLSSALTVPAVNAAPVIARAYNDTEVTGSYGALYINSITNVLKQCTALACNGSGWTILSPPINNPVFTGILTVPCVNFLFNVGNDTTVCSVGGTGHINLSLPNTSGTLALAGAVGNVSNSGTPLVHQAAIWVDATHIQGITPGSVGFVLTSNGTSADPTFQAAAGGGNVNNVGTPLNHQIASWTDATHIQGITPSTAGFVLTSNGTGADATFQPASVLGFPTPSGTLHVLQFNNSTTLSAGSGNNIPGGMWSQLGGTFSGGSNIANAGTPPYYNLVQTSGLAGAFSSLAEDAIAQQANFGIWQAYSCYCASEQGGAQMTFMGMTSVLYGSLSVLHPNGTTWGFIASNANFANYQGYVSTDNVTFTLLDTGVPLDNLVFHGFAMTKNSLGGIDYYIDGVKTGTIASGATGFPLPGTAVYADLNDGLLINSINLHVRVQSIRWWSTF
jgi:hypothetical protein